MDYGPCIFKKPLVKILIVPKTCNCTIAIGAVAYLGIGTYNDSGGTSVITDAATLYIEGAMAASGPTLTRTYALWVDSGDVRFDEAIVWAVDDAAVPTGPMITRFADHLLMSCGTAGYAWNNQANGAEIMGLTDAGLLFLSDTANTNMTIGLTINQGANDNQILAFKSSDVSHPMTALTETDTYGEILKSLSDGGLLIRGYTDTRDVAGLDFRGTTGVAASTTDTTSSLGVVQFFAEETDASTGTQDIPATGNVFGIAKGTGSLDTIVLFKGDGTVHAVDTTWATALDEEDDRKALRALQRRLSTKGIIASRWDKFINTDRKTLVEAGFYSTEAPNALLNMTQLWKFHTGGIWQNYEEIQDLKEELKLEQASRVALEQRLPVVRHVGVFGCQVLIDANGLL